jgi:ABC-type uncharacterized transport system involved in gliding motility auxiliary subunit
MRRKSRRKVRAAGLSPLRRLTIGLTVLVGVLSMLAIVVMLNYLANRHFVRIHVTDDPRQQLSPMSRQVLQGLTDEVQVIVFFEPDPTGTLYSAVRALLTEYDLLSPQLKVEYLDYRTNPGRAAQLKDEFNLPATGSTDLVIFAGRGRHKIVHEKELADYDLAGIMEGQAARRSSFNGEALFTSAILSVSEASPVRAYALTGHGEHDLESNDATHGYLAFARLLQEKNIEVSSLNLSTNAIPNDCELLIVAGPRYSIPPAELDQIRGYLNDGGRALILLINPVRPNVRKSGLESVLYEWNLSIGDDLVIDRAQSKTAAAEVLLTSSFGNHPIMRPLHQARLGLVTPRSVRPRVQPAGTDGIHLAELMFAGNEALAYSDTQGSIPAGDVNGPIPLAVAVEKGTIAGVGPDRASTRMVVVGESIFLGNTLMNWEANRDFASLTVNWLVDRSHLLQLGPRPLQEYRITLTQAQMQMVNWLLLAVFPGSVMLLGVLVWFRRRN